MKTLCISKYILILVSLFSPVLQAEDPYNIEWVDQFGSTGYDQGESIATDSSGNYYVVGTAGRSLDGETSHGGQDGFITKYNSNKERQWTRLIGTTLQDQGRGIAIDDNDNIYVGGFTYGEFSGQTSSGNVDAFLVKFDTDGTQKWTRQMGTDRVDWGKAIATDNFGNVYLVGQRTGNQENDYVFIYKYDSEGNQLWDRAFSSEEPTYWGKDDVGAVITDKDRNIYVVGSTNSYFLGQTEIGIDDAYIAKYDENGNQAWIRQFGTTSYDYAYSVSIADTDLIHGYSTIYVAGITYGRLDSINNNGYYDGFVTAFSSGGVALKSHLIGTNTSDILTSITADNNGSLYVAGYTFGNFPKDPSYPYSTYYNYGYGDIFVAKISHDYPNNSLTTQWIQQYGTRYADGYYLTNQNEKDVSISLDETGNIYVTGTTEGIFSNPTVYQKSLSFWDIFVIKLKALESNTAPIADAGTDFSVHLGQVANLNGGGSSDSEGDYPLAYEWTFKNWPEGSIQPTLENGNTVNPSFTPEYPGDYVLQLVVTDSKGLSSLPSQVTINTYNTPPVADAGADQSVTLVGSLINLDGSDSYDDDGDDLTYSWLLESKPIGSSATFDVSTAVTPTFTADINGEYEVSLTVTDVWGAEAIDHVIISFNNLAPVADAGINQTAEIGDIVQLNGEGSSDANNDPITFSWSLSTVPEGSSAVLSDSSSATPSFVPDINGTYIATLVVYDGIVYSNPDNSETAVVSFNTITSESVTNTINHINIVDEGGFKNPNLPNALTNKLNAVLRMIDNEQYSNAWNKLTGDIIPKTDGCVINGVPDKDDWIKTCEEQEQVYNFILKTLDLLETKIN